MMLPRRPRRSAGRRARGLLAACALMAVAAGASPAFAQGETSPWWHLSTTTNPGYLPPSGEGGHIFANVTNLGDAWVQASKEHPVTLTDVLPSGFKITGLGSTKWPKFGTVAPAKCHYTSSEYSCSFAEPLAPYEQWELYIEVAASVPPGSEHSEVNEVKVEGGGLPPRTLRRTLTVSGEQTPFGVENYEFTPENGNGEPESQAGSHPFQLTTTLDFNRIYYEFPRGTFESVPGLVKDLHVNLPPGLVGNTLALPQCTELQFTTITTSRLANQCPADSAVGAAVVLLTEPNLLGEAAIVVPVFNLVPSAGEPARFGFVAVTVPVTFDPVDRGGDYHVVVNVKNASSAVAILSSEVTIWGVPGDPRHDQSRGFACIVRGTDAEGQGETCEALNQSHPAPFLTLPTSCEEPLQTTVEAESWLPGASFLAPVAPLSTETLTGCAKLPFNPKISLQPRQQETNTPTGLTVKLTVPQEEEEGRVEAGLRTTEVKLPKGMQLSPSAADGLQACSLKEIGFKGVSNTPAKTDEFYEEEAKEESAKEEEAKEEKQEKCPKASKVGTVQIETPLLEKVKGSEYQVQGDVYLAAQNENPFNSLFGIYIVAKDPAAGVLVKLAGKVTADAETGQITTTFPNAPQLPFGKLKMELTDGPRASVATPRSCGSYTAQTSFTPWSTNELLTRTGGEQEFELNSGPYGTSCANPQPFNPGFQAGSTNNQAAAFTPFTLTITRPDTDQALKSVSMTLPPGLAGLLSQVKLCPEPQAEQGTCGPESQIGHATASVGLGGDPFTETGGRVYITGPYHGAPFGLSVVIPAKAGPFDFGNVVTRSTINVDPNTAAISINSDLPTMVNTTTHQTGIPVQLRRIDVTVERPGGAPFQFNPTNCTPMAITGTLTGDQGASAPKSYPFQVANCDKLPFAPKLTATAGAQASKNNGENLNVKIESQGLGQANIAKVDLTLPQVLPSRLTTIQKACVLAVFEANPAACDEGSVIGKATIHTPVLTNPLSGPAYLVSHGGAAFPDVEFVLQGEGITLVLDGKTDIKNGITYSRFESSPDAPFTTFETELPTGPHSALTAYVPASENYNLCKTSLVMPTVITGQNGAVISQTTKIAVTGCAGVLSFKAKRAAQLKKALLACRKKYKHNKPKRAACEKQAHKKYGPKAVKKKTVKKKTVKKKK